MIDKRKLLKLYIDFIGPYSMGKKELIDTIGRAMVDEDFRKKFAENADSVVDSISGLGAEEKDFLKNNSNKIRDLATDLNVKYHGESKRN